MGLDQTELIILALGVPLTGLTGWAFTQMVRMNWTRTDDAQDAS